MKTLILNVIRIYQKINPFKKYAACRFIPTCSEYTYQAVKKYGVFIGLKKGTWRILRCNPFNKGGHDPLR